MIRTRQPEQEETLDGVVMFDAILRSIFSPEELEHLVDVKFVPNATGYFIHLRHLYSTPFGFLIDQNNEPLVVDAFATAIRC